MCRRTKIYYNNPEITAQQILSGAVTSRNRFLSCDSDVGAKWPQHTRVEIQRLAYPSEWARVRAIHAGV